MTEPGERGADTTEARATGGRRQEVVDFPSLDGAGVRVAVVDSGIRLQHPALPTLSGGVDLGRRRGAGAADDRDFSDCAGHGTACAGIIHAKAPAAGLFSVRIFDGDLVAEEGALVTALDWVAAQGMDVANLSLGTTVFRGSQLARACQRASEAGVILVAAVAESGACSMPAASVHVISVGATGGLGGYEYLHTTAGDPEFLARGDAQRLCWLDPDFVMLGGTSFAAAHISALVALIRQQHPRAELATVRRLLRANATRGVAGGVAGRCVRAPGEGGGKHRGRSFAWLGRAAIYPFNKEMHALIRGRDLLEFTIAGVADPVGKGWVGRDAGEVIGMETAGLPIRASLEAVLADADALVLGCVDQLGRAARRDILGQTVATAVDHGKHVFSLLPVPEERYPELYRLARSRQVHIVTPGISDAEVAATLGDEAADTPLQVPVVGVFGTSSQQGKFTLQLALRRHLLEEGYRVGQIGTEHHAELFGMDLAFPMGYGSPLRLPWQHYGPFLRTRMHEICQRCRPDIMLVGGQSGTVPYDVQQASTHPLTSLAFLLGVRPDACVLVVNAGDPEEYIQDTIDGIRVLARAPVLLLAMSNRDRRLSRHLGRTAIRTTELDDAAVTQHLARLEQRFSLPAVCIARVADQRRAVARIIHYFSSQDREESAP